jgi:hypothetical protein
MYITFLRLLARQWAAVCRFAVARATYACCRAQIRFGGRAGGLVATRRERETMLGWR